MVADTPHPDQECVTYIRASMGSPPNALQYSTEGRTPGIQRTATILPEVQDPGPCHQPQTQARRTKFRTARLRDRPDERAPLPWDAHWGLLSDFVFHPS
jgi:hypothetical protein